MSREIKKPEKKEYKRSGFIREDIKRFGKPYWAEDMIVTCEINRHTFYKEK